MLFILCLLQQYFGLIFPGTDIVPDYRETLHSALEKYYPNVKSGKNLCTLQYKTLREVNDGQVQWRCMLELEWPFYKETEAVGISKEKAERQAAALLIFKLTVRHQPVLVVGRGGERGIITHSMEGEVSIERGTITQHGKGSIYREGYNHTQHGRGSIYREGYNHTHHG